jgi:FHS family L-fucose permease-like MFS transporter
MSVMFPTIYALGIDGLSEKSKLTSSFIVMAITGGALLPKLLGLVGDPWNMSTGFLVPLFCFAIVAVYGFGWSRMSGADSPGQFRGTAH